MKKRITQILFFFCSLLFSQQAEAILIENPPKNPNWIGNIDVHSSNGTDYWAAFLTHNGISENDPTLQLSIHAIADTTVNIIIEVNGAERGRIPLTADAEGVFQFQFRDGLAWNDVYLPSKDAETKVPRGVHIYSEDHKTPFSCYAFSEAGTGQGTTRASAHLLPTQLLGEQYYVQTYQTDLNATEFAVVATEDNTHITITTPVVTSKNHTEMAETLNKGQVFMVRSKFPGDATGDVSINMSGSFVCADKPVAVFQGNDMVKIAPGSVGSYSGNHVFNQAFPIKQLGKEHYIGITEHATFNAYNILAIEDNTTVNVNSRQPITLNAGETMPSAYWLNSLATGDKYAKITSNKPVMVTSYLTCGGANQEITATTINNWGNPTGATIMAWERRVKKASFFTNMIENETSQGEGHMYVQVVTKLTDRNKFTLDGNHVPDTHFSLLVPVNPATETKAIANIELTTEGKHTLETTGDGFVGFVYSITSESRAYQYTLDLTPLPLYDSLYVVQAANVNMSHSYNLEPVLDKGWYQRQWDEWLKGKERLDTVVVCDSTLVPWMIQTPSERPVDQIEWKILNVTTNKKGELVKDSTDSRAAASTLHTFQYKFELPEEPRLPFFEYKIQGILHRVMDCGDGIEDVDTLQTMVRVMRMYNDTTWRIVCAGDEFEFFSDTTATGERYSTKFYFEDEETDETAALPAERKQPYTTGPNCFTKSYESAGGCDSLSTISFFVCDPVRFTKDTTICEDGLTNFQAYLGDFFNKNNKIDFASSFAARDRRWVKQNDGSYIFEGISTLKTTSCFSTELREYINHGATYNGCDSTLTLKLRVMPVMVFKDTISICDDNYAWEVEGQTTIIYDTIGVNHNTPKTYTQSLKYTKCPDCPAGGCDSVRYELKLMFVNEQASDTIHLCQNDEPYAPIYTDKNSGEQFEWPLFNPKGKTAGEYHLDPHTFNENGGGCTYSLKPVIIVDSVTTYRDSVVYCYIKEGSIYHEWEGHKNFWYSKKGSNPKTLASNITIKASEFPTSAQGQLIYELSDTVLHTNNDCDTIYYQILILMPDYKLPTTHHMADDDVYEWDGKLLVGDQAADYENPEDLDVIVMTPERTDYPSKWSVTYVELLKEYTIVNATQTVPIYDIDGVAQQCDSTDTLHLRIGQKFDTIEYAHVCSTEDTYKWRGKDRTIPEDYNDTTILFYDSLTTKWPVIGLDSVYILSLTIYPSYRDTAEYEGGICQDTIGFLWEDHMGEGHELYINDVKMDPSWDSIPISKAGHYYITDKMQTKPRTFTDENTGESSEVTCDSIWVLDLTVNEVFDTLFHNVVIDSIVIKSNGTTTAFSPNATLFIGPDFDFTAYDDTKTVEEIAEELRIEAGAEEVIVMEPRDSVYSKTSLAQCGCDSTSYSYLEICWLERDDNFNVIIGDNDTVWTFGGNTTPDEHGVREHTHPYVSGWDFHVDEDGKPIDYGDTTRHGVRTIAFVDTMHTVNGCDSIIRRLLKVYPTYQIDTFASTCHNERFDWRGYTELNLLLPDSVMGVVDIKAPYPTKEGKVDSVYVLHLTIRPGLTRYYHKDICYNTTAQFYGEPVEYNPEFPGPDSVLAIYQPEGEACGNLFILYPSWKPAYGYDGDPDYKQFVDSIDAGICQYDEFHWYDKNGKEHIENLRDSAGNLYTSIPTDEMGWHTLYDSLKTVSCNCDSIYTLRYYVDRAYHYDTDTAICPGVPFIWTVHDEHGNEYTKDTIYSSDVTTHIYDTIHGLTTHGCDSSYYLHIFVDQPYDIYIDTVICFEDQHFEWEGDTGLVVYDEFIKASHYMTEKQEFWDTLNTFTVRAGCDSIMYLHLTIPPSPDTLWTDTICTGETYLIYDQEFTAEDAQDTIIFHRPNEWGCDITYKLKLDVFDPTQFTVTPEQICINEAGADITYTIRYTYQGEFQPVMYSIRYDSVALEAGFEDQDSIAIDEILVAGQEYELYIPTPVIANKEDYPRPDFYHAKIAFENGVCLSDSLMTYDMELMMNYPNWLMEQRHGDVIALLNEQYNGGYTWTEYQWYEGDQKLIGQTKPYLHIPTGLTPGAMYHVELTRTNDSIAFPTCEIEAIANPIGDDFAPTRGYLSVTPTCVVTGHPIIYILSRKDGNYRISSTEGQLVGEGVFRADVTEVAIPAVTGMYIVQLWSDDTPEEPYRAIKVLVREQCPNCDTSF